jgi:hypothetical protein
VRAAPPTVAISLTLAVLVAAGCGNERQHAPDVTGTLKPASAKRVAYPADGVSLAAPRNWSRLPGSRPLVASIVSGPAVVAVWRYSRKEPLPKTRSELEQAQANLSDAVQARDRSAHIDSTKVVDVNGVKGIQLVATERISGQQRRVRSTHLFDRRAEIVIDAYAPPGDFARLDDSVFQPLIRSLRLHAPSSTGA